MSNTRLPVPKPEYKLEPPNSKPGETTGKFMSEKKRTEELSKLKIDGVPG